MIAGSGEHDSDLQELFSYLKWACDALGLREELNQLRPETTSVNIFIQEVVHATRRYLLLGPAETLQRGPEAVLTEPDVYYRTEESETFAGFQTLGYIQMLSAMILGILGDYQGYQWLGSMLITDHLNRKLSISRFLAVLTGGEIGSTEPRIPSRSQAVMWARRINSRDVVVTSKLMDLARVGAKYR